MKLTLTSGYLMHVKPNFFLSIFFSNPSHYVLHIMRKNKNAAEQNT